MILDAARRVFEQRGLEGASLRAIAAEAGYTAAALYFHFDSKEAVYAALLAASLEELRLAVAGAAAPTDSPQDRLRAAAMGFFDFYERRPRDLELGFYLLHGGGMSPRGVGRDRDAALNRALTGALAPIGAATRELGGGETAANRVMAGCFAHATGLLLLEHTRRIRLFDVAPRDLMTSYVEDRIAELERREE
ncbi:TetR/AcrR family transcriptional regulator [Brevirhabdus sp.]|uniref:TetR/AcrR family transcriptional regulator n=1 Tax=Brevirhabdus sp. TaxID=2004514 RepID=UPI00405A4445